MSTTEDRVTELAERRVLSGIVQCHPNYPCAPQKPVDIQPLLGAKAELVAAKEHQNDLDERAAKQRTRLTLIAESIKWHRGKLRQLEAESVLVQTGLAGISYEIESIGDTSTDAIDAAIEGALRVNAEVAANTNRRDLLERLERMAEADDIEAE